MLNTSVDAAVRSYQLVIPPDTPFSLRLFSSDIMLADQNGSLSMYLDQGSYSSQHQLRLCVAVPSGKIAISGLAEQIRAEVYRSSTSSQLTIWR